MIEIDNKNLKIALGVGDFKKMVTENDIFVDKSLFIKEVIDASEEAILITYPRRWGKSLNINMLQTFFEPEDKNCEATLRCNKIIFDGGLYKLPSGEEKNISSLAISQVDSGKYMQYQGKYPVISISLKDVEGDSITQIESQLKDLAKSLYREHRHLYTSDLLEKDEKEDFRKYIAQDYGGISLKNSRVLAKDRYKIALLT
ncbi:AAA family ATPase [Candidatus Bandiella euplotis]|uniref:AAA-ATPase n=1 Tax=Candidatus Bandiella euplotis TaxID=1664265 RepID=A0ABZ0UM82_9RICK|nr:AAA family ATPase [Candidatus Bandiella woodruffii]WPX96168.1 Putative AAA-ATPase [Candidatus Bandiella woodruffii]